MDALKCFLLYANFNELSFIMLNKCLVFYIYSFFLFKINLLPYYNINVDILKRATDFFLRINTILDDKDGFQINFNMTMSFNTISK